MLPCVFVFMAKKKTKIEVIDYGDLTPVKCADCRWCWPCKVQIGKGTCDPQEGQKVGPRMIDDINKTIECGRYKEKK